MFPLLSLSMPISLLEQREREREKLCLSLKYARINNNFCTYKQHCTFFVIKRNIPINKVCNNYFYHQIFFSKTI